MRAGLFKLVCMQHTHEGVRGRDNTAHRPRQRQAFTAPLPARCPPPPLPARQLLTSFCAAARIIFPRLVRGLKSVMSSSGGALGLAAMASAS